MKSFPIYMIINKKDLVLAWVLHLYLSRCSQATNYQNIQQLLKYPKNIAQNRITANPNVPIFMSVACPFKLLWFYIDIGYQFWKNQEVHLFL